MRSRPRRSAGSVASAILARIKGDDPTAARVLLDGIDFQLSDAARAEWRQRVAWSFYIENDNASAYIMGQLAGAASGPWVAEGWWTAGLAAWRLNDCAGAAEDVVLRGLLQRRIIRLPSLRSSVVAVHLGPAKSHSRTTAFSFLMSFLSCPEPLSKPYANRWKPAKSPSPEQHAEPTFQPVFNSWPR